MAGLPPASLWLLSCWDPTHQPGWLLILKLGLLTCVVAVTTEWRQIVSESR